MIASRLNMISSPPPPSPSSGAGMVGGRKRKRRFFFFPAGICCIIMDEILFTQVYTPYRFNMSQVRLDGYMLRILQLPLTNTIFFFSFFFFYECDSRDGKIDPFIIAHR